MDNPNLVPIFLLAVIALATLEISRRLVNKQPVLPAGSSAAESKAPISGVTYRVQGVPLRWDRRKLRSFLTEECKLSVNSIASLYPECHGRSLTGTIVFSKLPDHLHWRLPASSSSEEHFDFLEFDTAFLGLTTLYTPAPEYHKIDIVAVPGLGGHAFGSFKERGGSHMWLRDALPHNLTRDEHAIARVLTYGYKSEVAQSSSVQTLADIANGLQYALCELKTHENQRSVILVAHSLGGLVVKQLLITLSRSSRDEDTTLAQVIYGFLFFGVPHAGMNIESLIPMVKEGPNRSLVESIGRDSQLLNEQQQTFSSLMAHGAKEIVYFYETLMSPTALWIPTHGSPFAHFHRQGNPLMEPMRGNGTWKMAGPPAILVAMNSATHGYSSKEKAQRACAVARTHSDLVKFSGPNDPEYRKVLGLFDSIVAGALENNHATYQSDEVRKRRWMADLDGKTPRPRTAYSWSVPFGGVRLEPI